ncbi:MAG: dockerin type I domain-containing protein [Candidatus Omnitrophota bacterium]
MGKLFTSSVGGLVLVLLNFTGVLAADVDVYAEGAYTRTELEVRIYADIKKGVRLVSGGVRLLFDPTQLEVINAEKNEDVWYLSDGVKKSSYMDPDFKTVPGEIVFIVGKLDAKAPEAGVIGKRVLLGRAIFGPVAGSSMPVDSASYVLGMTYGRGDGTSSYENFVTIDKKLLDKTGKVAFKPMTIHLRCDADENGQIDGEDIKRMEKDIEKNDNPLWYDCNGDGRIDTYDIKCIRQKLPE